VLGKGNKERIIYLNEACREALSEYLLVRKGEAYAGCTDRALFLSNRQARLSVQGVQVTVQKYLKMAGLASKHYSVHKLRHTAATLMYQSGEVDIRVLKDILGHEQLNTTQIYTHVSNRNMEEAMKHNPLSGEKD
jgi:site-specific recombinase XerD